MLASLMNSTTTPEIAVPSNDVPHSTLDLFTGEIHGSGGGELAAVHDYHLASQVGRDVAGHECLRPGEVKLATVPPNVSVASS